MKLILKLVLTLVACVAVLAALPAACVTLTFVDYLRDPALCSRIIGWQLARIGNRPPGEYELGKPYNPPRYEPTGDLVIDDALYCTLLNLELR